MDVPSTTEMENLSLSESVNKNLVFNINSNNDRPANLTVDNNKSLSIANSVERRSENYAFPSGVAHRLQNL